MADAQAPFLAFLDRVHPGVEDAIRHCLPKPSVEDRDIRGDLNRYLYEPLERLVFAGGKRIRPALCLLGCAAVGGAEQDALDVACAVEVFQAAALIHDDIADQSELRRGVPCLHVSEGTGIAINAGDVAVVDVAYQALRGRCGSSLDPASRLRLFDELYEMERRTLEGQALDLGWVRDGRWNLAESDYLAMATLKTAHYSAASPLVLGALCGDGNDEQLAGLRAFGLAAGLAFQIQDDLLNLVGDAEAQGKDFRSDITEGKRTLVMVRALSELGAADAAELRGILSSHSLGEDELTRAVELACKAGAVDYARDYAQQLVDNAKGALAEVNITDDARSVLLSMADFFVSRKS